MLSIHSILHPTDFSELSVNAFRLACQLALDYHATLHVLHVATSFEAYQGELVFMERSEQYLAKDWDKLAEYACPGVTIQRHLEEGEAAEQIIRVARAIGCDFIVMGSHGRSGLPRLLLGSVAEQVLREAACQVVIVKGAVAPLDNMLADRSAPGAAIQV